MCPWRRSSSSWNISSFSASSSIDDFAGEAAVAGAATGAEPRCASRGADAPATRAAAGRVGSAAVALSGCRFKTTQAPPARTTAKPRMMYRRYCCNGSGASMGAPSPPPGRLSRPCCCDAPEATCWGESEIVPVPFSVKLSDCPAWVRCATSTRVSPWLGSCMDWNCAAFAAVNCMDLGRTTTTCSAG